jgi:hypothetical protein
MGFPLVRQSALGALCVLGGLVVLGVAAPGTPFGAVAHAQTATGNLRGYVRNPAGAPVGEAQISARNLENNLQRGTLTNAAGFYYLGGMRPGRYEVTVRRIGFAPQARVVTIQIGATNDVNFSVSEQAAQLTAVRVEAASDAAETRTSEVARNVSREQIENLPNFERNFLDIARLVPGITASAVNSGDKVIAAGGQPAEAVNVFVDGATYKNDVLRGGVVGQDASRGNPFPQGAVQEFRVITQNYKAEYQKASSAIITATTRSGGNQWEGELFGYGIGKTWAARDAIQVRDNRPRGAYERLQAGASVGGPLVRDRLFFFGTYELNFRDEPQNIVLGGNAAQAPAGLNPQQYVGTFNSEFRQHLGFGKLTWNASERSTVDASVTARRETDYRGFGGQNSFETAENVVIDVYNGVANWRRAGDRWLNEAQANVQYFVWNPRPLNQTLIGREYAGIIRLGGRDSWQEFTQSRISLRNDVTRGGVRWLGDHVFKGGASLDFLGYDVIKQQVGNPVFVYEARNQYATPTRARFGFGEPRQEATNQQLGAYLQDDWTVTPKLVLNLGLRWDVETNGANNSYVTPGPLADSLRLLAASGRFQVGRPRPNAQGQCCDFDQINAIEQLGGIGNFISQGRSSRPAYLRAFQPRVGASYDVRGNGRSVVFGGLGIYYDRNYWNQLLDEQFRRQFRVLNVEFRDDCPADANGCTRWDPRYLDPAQLRTLSGPVGAPEVFLVANDLTPPRSVQSSIGLRQTFGGQLITVSYNGIRGSNGMNYVRVSGWGGLGPNYSTAFATDNRVKTWYDALQLQVERPVRADTRWGGSIAYTAARAREQGQSTDLFWGFDDRYPTVADRPILRAPGNQAHTIVANAIGILPYDVRLSGIVSLGTGITANATDASRGRGPFNERTYLYQPPTRAFLGVGQVFNTQNLDLRVEKGLPVVSGQRASLSVDLFNAFNSRNFGCYDAFINPSTEQPNANFDRPGCAGLGRRIQVGVRYALRPVNAAGTGVGAGPAPR